MLRSRMFTPGFRLYFALTGFFLVAAFVASVSTTLQTDNSSVKDMLFAVGAINLIVGPLTMGWKGGVGNHLPYVVLTSAAGIAAFLAFVLVAFRDADPEAEAEYIQADTVPLTRAPQGTSFNPVLGAVSVLLLAVGLVAEGLIGEFAKYGGIILLLLIAGTWTIRAWAERATGDAEVNYGIYKQMIDPLRVPVLGAIGIAFVVFGFSRALLAAPDENVSRFLFLGVGFLFFVGVVLIAIAPKVSRGLVATLLILVAAGLIASMVWFVIDGERPIGEGEGHGGTTTEVTQEGGFGPVGGVIGQ